jgi:hypothetical protein
LVAELVGEGKISWDSKISDLDPDFEMYDIHGLPARSHFVTSTRIGAAYRIKQVICSKTLALREKKYCIVCATKAR